LDVERSAFSERAIEVNRRDLKPQLLPGEAKSAADLSARSNLIFLKALGELHGAKVVFNE
jgi:hypothetical protein